MTCAEGRQALRRAATRIIRPATGRPRIRVLLGGMDAGSGFAITEGRALTAGHVVRDATKMAAARARHGR